MPLWNLLKVCICAWATLARIDGVAQPMLDPATDRTGEEWCYLAKSTTVIGVPFQPDVTQITFDGAVFTRNAELCFFYGDKDRPLLARGKIFLGGWMPVVQYAWTDGDIAYEIEYFAALLDGETVENTVNFIRLQMRNTGAQAVTGGFAAALRHTGGDYRFGGTEFSPHWRYEMTDSAVHRDGKLAWTFTRGAIREASLGVAYTAPFEGQEQFITARAECCLARYRRELKPGESFAATFKMPRVPVASAAYNAKVLGADYQACRAGIVAYWTKLFQNTPVVELPEKRFQDTYRASLVHVLLATRTNAAGKRWQTDGLPYPDFFLTSVPEMAMLYLTSGMPEYATDLLIPGAIAQQQGDGLYFDRAVASGKIIPATQGHILYSIAQTVLFTQDKAFAEKIYPSLQKGVAFIAGSIKTNEFGLLPRCWPYDAEMIDGHYTGQNLFALMGLRHAVRVARFLGKTDDAAEWTKRVEQYEANLLKAIAASAKPDGYIPTGLYTYTIGKASSRPNWEDCMYDADWENMILVWPTEVLAPADPRVQGTLRRIRKDYAEGIMTYRHGLFLHQYITANMIEQYLAMGETYTALKDFYHQLLHSGSTHESFENLVKPWADRMVDPGCPPPHAWGTSKQGLMVRHFLLMECGGKCGVEPGQRELWLFHCLSPAWVKPGEHVAIRNAPTEFGKISAEMSFSGQGAHVVIASAFHEQPASLRLRVPYFKELVRFKTDAKASRQDGDCILVSADATTVSIEWRDKPGAHLHTRENILTDYRSANRFKGTKNGKAIIEAGQPFLLDSEKSESPQPLSFELVRETFQHECARLAPGEKGENGKPVQVTAPAGQTAEQHRAEFEKQFSKAETLAAPTAHAADAALDHVAKHTALFTLPPKHVPTPGMPDGPLLGNGDVGVALAGPPEAQRFHIGKNDFWRRNPADASVMAVGVVSLLIPGLQGATYHQEQDFARAEVRGTFAKGGVTLHTRSWVDANENLLVTSLRCEGTTPLTLSVRQTTGALTATPTQNADNDRVDGVLKKSLVEESGGNVEKQLAMGWFTRKADSLPGRSREVAVATRILGVTARTEGESGFEVMLKPGETLAVVSAVLSDLDAPEFLAAAKQRVAALQPKNLEALSAHHQQWWADFWAKSFIEIPDQEIEKRWYAALYVMGSCSRAGKVAPGLWGNWITTDRPNWHGDFHLNYNFQAPYYIVYSANHPDLSLPFYQAILESVPNGRAMAQRHGWKGVHFPVSIGPWGLFPENPDGDWGQRSDAAFAALNFIWQYQYTQDTGFLRTHAYPYLREVADFWEDYLKFENGRYVIYNDSIHEGSGNDMNPILSLGLVRTLFKNLLQMSSDLGVDAERRTKWQDIADKTSAFPLQERNGKTVFRYSEKGVDWWNDNTLGIHHIFPAGAIGLDSDPKLLEISHNTIAAMSRWHDNNGFSSWYTACARIGYDPRTILANMRKECDQRSYPNLLLYYGGGGIENVAGFLAVNEMLLQGHEGVLRFFPVWPKEQNARFGDLRTVGAFLVSAELKDGLVDGVRIRSEKGRACTVQNPWPGRKIQLVRNGTVEEVEMRSGDRFTFKTAVNDTIELHHR